MCLWLCSQSYQLQSVHTHGEIKMFTPLMVAWGEGWEKRIVRKLEMVVYTRLYLKWLTNKDLLNSTWNSAQCYVAAWMGREFGGEWIHVCIWLSLFTIHLKPLTTLLISYISTQNKRFKTKNKKKKCSYHLAQSSHSFEFILRICPTAFLKSTKLYKMMGIIAFSLTEKNRQYLNA